MNSLILVLHSFIISGFILTTLDAWKKSFLQNVTVSEIKRRPQNSTEILIVQETIWVFFGFFVVLLKLVRFTWMPFLTPGQRDLGIWLEPVTFHLASKHVNHGTISHSAVVSNNHH